MVEQEIIAIVKMGKNIRGSNMQSERLANYSKRVEVIVYRLMHLRDVEV